MVEHRPIVELSIVELKSLAYDELVKLELAQTNLRTINAEIHKKSQDGCSSNGK